MEKPEFYGSTTVGERGQVVLPADLRKKLDINPGDKLLVMTNGPMGAIGLVKAEVLNLMMEHMTELAELIKEADKEE